MLPLGSAAEGPAFTSELTTDAHVQRDDATAPTLPHVDQERTGLEEAPLQEVARMTGRGGPGRG